METDDDEWWRKQREHSGDTVRFFSEPGRSEREGAPVAEFLKYLGVRFSADELCVPQQDSDVDVEFGAAHFQNIEIMNPDRRRHDEVKQRAERVQQARPSLPMRVRQSGGHSLL